MLNRSACLAKSTRVLKALPDKLDVKRHSPSIFYAYTVVPGIRGALPACNGILALLLLSFSKGIINSISFLCV